MGKKILSVVMIALMATMVLSIQPSARAQPTRVLVGWSMPLTFFVGELVETAYTHHMYYWMCIDDINNAGGLNVPGVGQLPIEYIVLDDTYNENIMKQNYEALISMGCDLLLAPWSSEFNQAIAPTFELYQYPLMGLTVGSDLIVEKCKSYEWNYTFLVLGQPYEDAEQIVEVVSFINSKVPDAIKIRKAGVAYRADTHGQQHAWAIMDALVDMGITIEVEHEYDVIPAPSPDWDTFVSDCQDAGVDLVLCCGYSEVRGCIDKCKSLGFEPKLFIHGPGLETPNLIIEFGFTPGLMAGCMYYNGWPATAYKSPTLQTWYEKHRVYSKWFWKNIPTGYLKDYPYGYAPFPASAVFYAGVEALFRAVEMVGFPTPANRELIRDKLEFEAIPITLGLGSVVGTIKFNRGAGSTISEHGTITQWQGGEMMDVIWPKANASTKYIIYPKYPWSWGSVPDVAAEPAGDPVRDGKVSMVDLWLTAKDYGWRGPPYQKRTDVATEPAGTPGPDGKVSMVDLWFIAKHYGQKAEFGGLVSLSP